MRPFSAARREKVHGRFSESPVVDSSTQRLDKKRQLLSGLRANELVMKGQERL